MLDVLGKKCKMTLIATATMGFLGVSGFAGIVATAASASASTTIGHQLTLVSTGTRDCTPTSESNGGLVPVTVTITNTKTSDSYEMQVDDANNYSASDDHPAGTGNDASNYTYNVFVPTLDAYSQNVFIYGSGTESNDITISVPSCKGSTTPPAPPAQQAPVVSLTLTPASLNVGDYVSASLTDSTTEQGNTTDSFAWGDGSNTVGSDTLAQHPYGAASDYVVTGCITNSAGTGCATATVHVTVPPTAPSTPDFVFHNSGMTFTFNGSTPAGTQPFGFGWQFGDGRYDVGLDTTHTYAKAGIYTVTYTVHNSVGAVSVSKKITISAPAPKINSKANSVAAITKLLKGLNYKVGNTILGNNAAAPKSAPKGYKLVVVGYRIQPSSKKMTITVVINGKKVKEKVPAYTSQSIGHTIPFGDTVALIVKQVKA